MKMNEQGRQKLEGQNSWCQTKHVKLYPELNLPQFSVLGRRETERGPAASPYGGVREFVGRLAERMEEVGGEEGGGV